MGTDTKVFVYGTLRSGQGNHHLLADAASIIRPAIATGLQLKVPSHGGFPYAVPHPEARTVGEIVTIPATQAEQALERLDRLEGYDADRPHQSHYLRVARTVQVAGTTEQAWVYIAGPHTRPDELQPIPSGDWTRRRR